MRRVARRCSLHACNEAVEWACDYASLTDAWMDIVRRRAVVVANMEQSVMDAVVDALAAGAAAWLAATGVLIIACCIEAILRERA